IVRASADVNPPETPLDARFDDKSGRHRVIGGIEFAIDGNNDTAWGIDTGAGRRNQPRKAGVNFAQPISNPGGTILKISLNQSHGGSNSNDNQNNNLGRIRLSVTGATNAQADPLPQQVREILSNPRAERSAAQVQTVFSYWRTTVAEWRDENATIAALW